MVNYGIIIPSIVWEKLSDFVKKQPKPLQLFLGFAVGLPLLFIDILLTLATPVIVFVMFLFSMNFIPQKVAFFLYEIIMVLLNRYVTKRREMILVLWQGFFMMLNIFIVFMLNNGSLTIIRGAFFMLASLACGIVNLNVIALRVQNKDYTKYEIAQKITDVIFIISTIVFAI